MGEVVRFAPHRKQREDRKRERFIEDYLDRANEAAGDVAASIQRDEGAD